MSKRVGSVATGAGGGAAAAERAAVVGASETSGDASASDRSASRRSRRSSTPRMIAWKVGIAAIKASGFNLDQKNPHAGPEVSHDPDELMAEYQRLQAEAQGIRNQFKAILGSALAGRGEVARA